MLSVFFCSCLCKGNHHYSFQTLLLALVVDPRADSFFDRCELWLWLRPSHPRNGLVTRYLHACRTLFKLGLSRNVVWERALGGAFQGLAPYVPLPPFPACTFLASFLAHKPRLFTCTVARLLPLLLACAFQVSQIRCLHLSLHLFSFIADGPPFPARWQRVRPGSHPRLNGDVCELVGRAYGFEKTRSNLSLRQKRSNEAHTSHTSDEAHACDVLALASSHEKEVQLAPVDSWTEGRAKACGTAASSAHAAFPIRGCGKPSLLLAQICSCFSRVRATACLEGTRHGRWTRGSRRTVQRRVESVWWMVARSQILASKHSHCFRRLGSGDDPDLPQVCRIGTAADPAHPTDPFATLVQELRRTVRPSEALSPFQMQ